jgi:hypothetical protein
LALLQGSKGEKMESKWIALLFLVVFAAGCSSPKISDDAAKQNATAFIQDHVRFFSQNGTSQINVTQYNYTESITGEAHGEFSILVHVTATLDGFTKSNDINLKVNSRTGSVTEVNGKRI